MTEPRDHRVYLEDILDAINSAESFIWRSITGMRDKLIHSYSGVDLEVVWRTVRNELRPLRRQIEELLTSDQH